MTVIAKDHNKLFEEAQEKYLQNRTDKNLSELWKILLDYYCNLYINYTHKKGLTWSDDIIREKASDSASRMIEKFLRKPDFKVDKLTSYGHWDFIKILYQDKDWEMLTTSYETYSIGILEKENQEELTAVRYYDKELR